MKHIDKRLLVFVLANAVLAIKEKDKEFQKFFILFFYEINAKKLCFVGCVKEIFEGNAEDLG